MKILTKAVYRAAFTAALCIVTQATAFAEPVAVVPAVADASVPFPDVPAQSWMFDAIRQLASDGFLTGYPDGTLKGDRPMTRYEVSVLVSRVVSAMKDRMAQGQHPPAGDLELINKLAASMQSELADVNTRVDSLQRQTVALAKQVDATKKEADTSAANLKAFQVKLNIFDRPGTFAQSVLAVNGPTALLRGAIAPGATLPSGLGNAPLGNGILGATGQGTSIGQNIFTTGTYQHGTNWQETRVVFTGQPSQNLTYYVRLENKYEFSAPNYQSFTSPGFCTSTTPATLAGVNACQSQGYAIGNTPVRLNQSWVQYATPSGYFAKLGRWQEDEGTASSLGLGLGGNYTNGVQAGYRGARLQYYGAYGFNDTALTNQALNNVGCPVGVTVCANQAQQLIMGMASYDVTRRTNIGATYDGVIGNAFTLWNPAAGLCAVNANAPAGTASATTLNTSLACPLNTSLIATPAGPVTGAYQTATTNLDTLTVNATQFIGSKMKFTAEFAHRFGNDPFTHAAWLGSNAYGAQLDFASRGMTRPGPLYPGLGVKNSNVYEVAWMSAGFNGLSPEAGPGGTTPWQSFYFNSLNGFQWSWLTYQHWFSDTFRAGVVYHHFQTAPGQFQPAGSVTCPGCFLKNVNANALFVETYLNM